MKVIVIGAAKPGYSESITRKLIQNGYSVIGTYDSEFEENAQKLLNEYSPDQLILQQVDLSSREELASFVEILTKESPDCFSPNSFFTWKIQMRLIMKCGISVLR